MQKKTIGKFICELRKSKGFTQKELGEKLFVSDKTVSRWENDDCDPELSLIPAIADLFGITTDELLRCEKQVQAIPAPTQDEKELSEKQFKLLLHNHKKKFGNFSLLSIGLAFLGFMVASICNLCFTRGLLGFILGNIFFIASAICQFCFTTSCALLIDEDQEERALQLKCTNTDFVLSTIKILFGIWLLFAFCLPIAIIPTNSYFGLSIETWIPFGFIFTLIAFLVGFSFYKLYLFNLLIQKEIIWITDCKQKDFNENRLLFKKVLKIFLIIFLSLTAGFVTISIIEENNGFLKVEQFTTAEEFIKEAQKDYNEWYHEAFLEPSSVNVKHADWDELDGKQFYYRAELYYIFNPDNLYFITQEAYHNSNDTAQTFYICLTILQLANLFACGGWYYVKSKKLKEKNE